MQNVTLYVCLVTPSQMTELFKIWLYISSTNIMFWATSSKWNTKLQAQIKAHTTIKYRPYQWKYLLVTQSPAHVDSAAACPLLSGHNVHHTASPSVSERQKGCIMSIRYAHPLNAFRITECVSFVILDKWKVSPIFFPSIHNNNILI